MITTNQALRACLLSQFFTRVKLKIIIFRYFSKTKLLYIETEGSQKIKIEINEKGKFRYVE